MRVALRAGGVWGRLAAMGIRDRVVGVVERAVLSAAISVLVFFVERRLRKAVRKKAAGVETNKTTG